MKMIIMDLYLAADVYDMFDGCWWTHINDFVYFAVPYDLYLQHYTFLPKHLLVAMPFNPKNPQYEIINNS